MSTIREAIELWFLSSDPGPTERAGVRAMDLNDHMLRQVDVEAARSFYIIVAHRAKVEAVQAKRAADKERLKKQRARDKAIYGT